MEKHRGPSGGGLYSRQFAWIRGRHSAFVMYKKILVALENSRADDTLVPHIAEFARRKRRDGRAVSNEVTHELTLLVRTRRGLWLRGARQHPPVGICAV